MIIHHCAVYICVYDRAIPEPPLNLKASYPPPLECREEKDKHEAAAAMIRIVNICQGLHLSRQRLKACVYLPEEISAAPPITLQLVTNPQLLR